MALRYGYFDSEIIGVDDEGMPIFDRAELSDLFALLLASLVSDGVLARPSTNFRVRAAGSGLNLELDPGFGMVRGHFCYDNEVSFLTIEAAPQQYSRIDRVVMRCNYLQRMVEIIIKTGEEAANPVPPGLLRPASGDYYELCLADIRLSAGQKMIMQSNITDTRADSSVCGYITQLIDHLDTAVFFTQLNAFYKEFVQKSNTSYEEFCQMTQKSYDEFFANVTRFYNTLSEQAQELHEQYNADLIEYLSKLQEKGDTDLAAITEQLISFRNENEAEFLAWVQQMKDILGEDAPGELLTIINELRGEIEEMQEMLLSGNVMARLLTDSGNYIVDSMGRPLLSSRPICKCN